MSRRVQGISLMVGVAAVSFLLVYLATTLHNGDLYIRQHWQPLESAVHNSYYYHYDLSEAEEGSPDSVPPSVSLARGEGYSQRLLSSTKVSDVEEKAIQKTLGPKALLKPKLPPHLYYRFGARVKKLVRPWIYGLMRKQYSERFEIKQPFSLPVSFATRPAGELLQSEWVQSLKTFLGSLQSNLVNIVSSDYSYREVLLNWLISATIKLTGPLTNILVLSSDASLHKLLQSKGISCIHIPPESLIDPGLNLQRHNPAFSQVHIMRLTVMRLINHWGFDVANYDTDAIILKNPEPLYRHYGNFDLIGSVGYSAEHTLQVWGVEVCMGVVMVRSTSHTETFWEEMTNVTIELPDTTNDQARINSALKEMDMKWNRTFSTPRGRTATLEWHGSGRQGFTVLVLPTSVVCRQTCTMSLKAFYYIWHKGGKQSGGKMATASRGGLWFLRQDWETISNRTTARGEEWMKAIATS